MPIRVIIAEDHTVVREGTRRILEAYKDIDVVGEAADGEAAVRLAEKVCPDVAIVDIAMPLLNGIEATRRIKAISPQTRVLILTAYDDDQYISAFLEAGAAGYLLKTVRGRELAGAVRAVCRGEAVIDPAVVAKLVGRMRPRPQPPIHWQPLDPLTDRELEVLRLAAQGLSNKLIGRELHLSHRTVQLHLSHIFQKLEVASRTEAVVKGLSLGLLRMEDLRNQESS